MEKTLKGEVGEKIAALEKTLKAEMGAVEKNIIGKLDTMEQCVMALRGWAHPNRAAGPQHPRHVDGAQEVRVGARAHGSRGEATRASHPAPPLR